MSRSGSDRRSATVSLQTLLGCVVLGIWVVVGVFVMDEDLPTAVFRVLPFFLAYELGVLSRYFPGLQNAGKISIDWVKARQRS